MASDRRPVPSRIGRRMAAAAAFATLAACSLEPTYVAPALPVADHWSSVPETPADAVAASDLGWRDFFVDEPLKALIAQALANNRDLRVAVLNVASVRAQYRIQQADRLPTITADASVTRQKLPPALSDSGGSQSQRIDQVGLGINAFELDLFGRVRSLSHSALEQVFAQEESRRAAQIGLVSEVAIAYLTLGSDRQSLQLARNTLQSQLSSFELTRKSHDQGGASGLDLALAGTTIEAARADVGRYEGSVAQDIDALELLVGAPLDASSLAPPSDEPVTAATALPAGLPSTVLLRRPDVLAAEHLLRAADANIGAARAACFPTLSLTATGGTASEQLSGLFKSASSFWTLVPSAVMPIFDAGRTHAAVDVSQADRDIALAQYEKTVQTAFRDVADALALSGSLARQREAAQALMQVSSRAYDLSQSRYKAGRDSYLAVLDSERSSYAAHQRLIAVNLAEQSDRVELYKALGGGWLEHSAQRSAKSD